MGCCCSKKTSTGPLDHPVTETLDDNLLDNPPFLDTLDQSISYTPTEIKHIFTDEYKKISTFY